MGDVVWVLWQISYAFQQCKNFEKQLRFDKVTESLKVGTFLRRSVDSILASLGSLIQCFYDSILLVVKALSFGGCPSSCLLVSLPQYGCRVL